MPLARQEGGIVLGKAPRRTLFAPQFHENATEAFVLLPEALEHGRFATLRHGQQSNANRLCSVSRPTGIRPDRLFRLL